MGLFDKALVVGVSGRGHGNMSLNYGDTRDSLDNRKDFLGDLGIDLSRLVCAKQVHGCAVALIEEADAGKGACSYVEAIDNTDALITRQPGLALAIFTADCLPVFLYDPLTNSIGLVHAGWKGTKSGIAAETAGQMKKRFGARSGDLCAWMGPAIGGCCYQVGPEFADLFVSGLSEKENSLYLDLAAVNKEQLLSYGLKDKNISAAGQCTMCDGGQLFSYRKEGKAAGRMMSVMMLRDCRMDNRAKERSKRCV
ncbi:MAG: peptidoglycan editing factor PgeF [Candidatus Omnitrophica bacterium]|nr:peptidoglycan editing factor PgeF [Candidatus Omnitrophota bacterium]